MAGSMLTIRGCERSGTNWVEALCKANFDDVFVTSHRKHEPLTEFVTSYGEYEEFRDKPINYLCVVRHPLAWIYSRMMRWKNRPIKARFNTSGRQINRRPVDAIIHCWNTVNGSYLDMAEAHPERVMVVTYEGLLADPQGVLKSVSEAFGLKMRSDFNPVGNEVTYQAKVLGGRFDKSVYLDQKYLDRIGEPLAEQVMTVADDRLLALF